MLYFSGCMSWHVMASVNSYVWGAGGLFTVALVTSMLWYMFWLVMAPVKNDIIDLVNWFFFMKLQLWHVPDVYGMLGFIHNWLPLLVLFVAVFNRITQKATLLRIAQGIYSVVILYNVLLFVYLLSCGQKITSLFLVVLPLQLIEVVSTLFPISLLCTTAIVVSLYCLVSRADKGGHIFGKWWEPSFMGAAKRILTVFTVPVLLPLVLNWLMVVGCRPCSSERLPTRPGVIGHRGCIYSAPENSIAAFEDAVKIDGVIGLETDVQFSSDGVAFLLHDPHLVRTSDIRSKCPSVDPLSNATLLGYHNGSCPLKNLNIGRHFTQSLPSSHPKYEEFSVQQVPTLEEYLAVAKREDKVVIFDLYEPPVGHASHSVYLNKTLDVVLASGIPHEKVWWLPKPNKQWVYAKCPSFAQVTRSDQTDFEDFEMEHISIANDDWTLPLNTFRKYQRANTSIIMFFVDSVFMFRYAWCVGVQFVTTSNCRQLASVHTNPLYEACHYWRIQPSSYLCVGVVTTAVSLILMICIECKKLLKKSRAF